MSHRIDLQDLTDQKLRKFEVCRVNFSKIGQLDSGPISPSPLKHKKLGEIGPESNGHRKAEKQLKMCLRKGQFLRNWPYIPQIFSVFGQLSLGYHSDVT